MPAIALPAALPRSRPTERSAGDGLADRLPQIAHLGYGLLFGVFLLSQGLALPGTLVCAVFGWAGWVQCRSGRHRQDGSAPHRSADGPLQHTV